MSENKNWYDRSYKYILLVPIAAFLISAIYLVNFNAQNGDIILKDVSLTGGTSITVFDGNVQTQELRDKLITDFPDLTIRSLSDFRSGEQTGFLLETQADVETIRPVLEQILNYELTQENSSIEFTGAVLSEGFYQQLRLAIIFAFIFMAIVVFILFRTLVPSGAVIAAALSDIVMTVAVIDLMGIRVSSAGIIAFLMLIGYSVDTDILLTTRVIKRKEGSINSRLKGALSTGFTMTLTSMGAVTIYLLTIYSASDVLRQIFTILLIGLVFDLFNTWLFNAGIIKWYAEKTEAFEK